MIPAEKDVAAVAALKYADGTVMGWSPMARARAGYHTPDEWYEATVCAAVTPETDWLDVGCGSSPLPANPAASALVAERCRSMTGIDPSDNIHDNKYLDHRCQCVVEDFKTDAQFDVITLRMVAEHVVDPDAACAALARLCRPGGRVIIYTVDKWSPVSLVAAITPMSFHHWAKSRLWGGEEKDTFPTAYRMNTRQRLAALFQKAGMREESFRYLGDTRTTAAFRWLNALELWAWRALRSVRLDYPERCLLGIYAKP